MVAPRAPCAQARGIPVSCEACCKALRRIDNGSGAKVPSGTALRPSCSRRSQRLHSGEAGQRSCADGSRMRMASMTISAIAEPRISPRRRPRRPLGDAAAAAVWFRRETAFRQREPQLQTPSGQCRRRTHADASAAMTGAHWRAVSGEIPCLTVKDSPPLPEHGYEARRSAVGQ